MNVVSIESVSPEGMPLAAKADTEGSDLFSVLMASIAAANVPQQGSYNVSVDSKADFTGVATFSNGNEPTQAPDKGVTVDLLAKGLVAEETAGLTPVPFFSESADTFLANEAAKSELPFNIVEASFPDESLLLTKVDEEQPSRFVIPDVFNREPGFKTISPTEAFGNDRKVFSEQDDNSHPGNKTGILEKAAAGSFVQPDSGALEEDPTLLTAAQPFLQQAMKGAKTGNGIEGNEASIAAIGKDEIETVKNADTGVEISPTVGQSTLDPGYSNISSKIVAEVGKDFQAAQNPAIEPADLIAQVSGKIKADFKGEGGEVKMELHPESLGHLKVEIKVEGGVVRANILTENAMVRDAIDSNLPMLKISLESHGLRIDQLSVGVDQRQNGGNFAERNGFHGWQESNGRKTPYQEEDGEPNERWSRYSHQQEDGLSIFA